MSKENTIDVLSAEAKSFAPGKEFSNRSHLGTIEEYESLYRESIDDMEGFWARMATEFLDWSRPWTDVVKWDFTSPKIEWFIGGKLNAA